MTVAASLPIVTIGIPTYNRCEKLKRTLDSALSQTYPHIRVAISDNASTDDTRELCEHYAAADARVTYHRKPQNEGPGPNFQQVLRMADSELFMWLGDDDWIDADYVRCCVNVLLRDPDVVMAAGSVRYHGENVPKHLGKPVDCTSDSASLRVFQYQTQVDDNSIFYGVARLPALRRLELPTRLAGDGVFIGGMAYQGKLQTLRTVAVHRGWGGASRDLASMVRMLSLPSWQAKVPLSFFLAAYSFSEVAWASPVYADKPAPVRWLFGLALFCWICAFKPAQELHRRLRARLATALGRRSPARAD